MIISTVNYHKTFFPKPDLTRILGIPTYGALHEIYLELKNKALSVHFILGGATHIHLGIFMTNTKYATLSPIPYAHPVHPGILLTPNNATHVASYELKQVYENNLWVFHKVCGVEQALIQKLFISVDDQNII